MQAEQTAAATAKTVEGPLVELHPGRLWTKDIPLSFLGLQCGARMSVLRLNNGDLLLHSPVSLDDETRGALDALGPVRYVASPNKLHHMFMEEYAAAYPKAILLASPGLKKRRPLIKFHGELGDAPLAVWQGEVDQIVFRGHHWVEEIVFCHRPSRTLLIADLLVNIGPAAPRMTRVMARAGGVYRQTAVPADFRLLVTDRQKARKSVAHVLGWDFDRIVLSHGPVVETKGKAVFRRAFGWLFR